MVLASPAGAEKEMLMLRTFILIGILALGGGAAAADDGAPGDDARSILERYVGAWRGAEEMNLDERVVLGITITGEGGGEYTVTLDPDGTARLEEGRPPSSAPRLETDIEMLRRIDRDEISAFTAMARAQWDDPTPLQVHLPPGFRWTAKAKALYFPLTFHFFNRSWPEVIPFGESASRFVHGGNSAIFYYDLGLRTAWYQVKPGMHVNAEPKDQINPFPSLFIFTRGAIQARLGGEERTCAEGEAVLVPAGMTHEFWAKPDQYGELILIMFGEGA
jgi:mannose-6-phosphate isomerase-like protein (cupin superfamily)